MLGLAMRPKKPPQNADPSGKGLLNSGAERSEALAGVGVGPRNQIMLTSAASCAVLAATGRRPGERQRNQEC
jgi:hypothetical protein